VTDEAGNEPVRTIDPFVEGRTSAPDDWRWLWEGDHEFPIQSHRGIWGRVIVRVKSWLRPLVRAVLADRWERQRRFNLVVVGMLERLGDLERKVTDIHRDLNEVRGDLDRDIKHSARRIDHLEAFDRRAVGDLTLHFDSVFARVDQKFDQYRRESRDLWSKVGSLLATADGGGEAALRSAHEEVQYIELEDRFRGLESDIAERLSVYKPYFEPGAEVLDLGCGRGEALEVLGSFGLAARGVDSSAKMVQTCEEKGLSAQEGDLFEVLAGVDEGSLGGVVSFHVIEHLPATTLGRLTRLAWRALKPGGVLILETPNPMSLVVAARNFWLDPTHQRPVHPQMLELFYEQAGFERIERLDLRQFAAADRLPELDVASLAPELQGTAHEINGLRDRLDDLLFGYQDFAVLGFKS